MTVKENVPAVIATATAVSYSIAVQPDAQEKPVRESFNKLFNNLYFFSSGLTNGGSSGFILKIL